MKQKLNNYVQIDKQILFNKKYKQKRKNKNKSK